MKHTFIGMYVKEGSPYKNTEVPELHFTYQKGKTLSTKKVLKTGHDVTLESTRGFLNISEFIFSTNFHPFYEVLNLIMIIIIDE